MNFRMNVVAFVALAHAVCGYAHGHGHNHGASYGYDPFKAVDGALYGHGQKAHKEEPSHQHGPGCHGGHDHGAKKEGSHGGCAEGGQQSQSVTVSKAVQGVMGLKTVHAEFRRVASTVSFAGRYELNPDARKVVATPVPGRLSLLVKPLADVKKGDELFKVSSPDLVARSHEIEALEKRVRVYREIKTPNAALENELAVKRAERAAMLAGAEEKDGVITVRAAADGMVESLVAQDGAWLETGAAAVQTVQTRDLRFKALVAASDALQLKDGMAAKVGGHLGRIRIGVGDDTGLVPIFVLFDGDVHALAGARSHAECVTDETEEAHAAVPSRCIVSVGLQPTVFVRDAHGEDRFTAVPVTPGVSGGGWTAVDGLPSRHCEVVSDGAYELKLALPAVDGNTPSGHFHADGTFHEGEH